MSETPSSPVLRSDPAGLRPAGPATCDGADAPSPWIARWLAYARPGGRVLDFASGAGRHARMARAAGFAVLAVDRDAACLASLEGTGIETRQEDLEGGRWSFTAERFDAVVCTRYLFRPRLDLMASLLAPGGLWLYETFAVGQARRGRHGCSARSRSGGRSTPDRCRSPEGARARCSRIAAFPPYGSSP